MLALCIESSHVRGMGHLFRALALADGLRQQGVALRFFLNDHAAACKLISDAGFAPTVVPLQHSGEWENEVIAAHRIDVWVNDRLNTDLHHAEVIKRAGLPLVTFDDRGSGAALADLNFAALIFDEVERLSGRRILQGIDYLVLNPQIRRFQRQRQEQRSVLVTLGGSDTYGVTLDVIRHLSRTNQTVTVVVGPGFAHLELLKGLMPSSFVLKQSVPSLIEEFHAHDLAITGGGVTPFEATASGLPVIVIANEPFEVPVGEALSHTGAAVFAGYRTDVNWQLLDQTLPVKEMSANGMSKIGLNGRERVIETMTELTGWHR